MKGTHRIAVISDTHGVLRPEVLDTIRSCEMILHGGDIDKQDILSCLETMHPTYAVRGNTDKDWAEKLPKELKTELFGIRIYMVHNKKHIPKDLSDVDLVIYGHSHKYEVSKEGSVTYLNPGSCGPRRFRLPVTLAVLTVYEAEHKFEIERIECLPLPQQKEISYPQTDKDMYKLVKRIMKDADAGKKIADIALRNQVEEELVEQICRLYVTHPGVDVDGILDRMEKRNLL